MVEPCTEAVTARIPEGTADDVDAAVAAVDVARRRWGRLVPRERADVLLRVADRLAENSQTPIRLEALNAGKQLPFARDDVESAVDTFRFMTGAVRATTRRRSGSTPRTTCRSSCASRWASSGSSHPGTTSCSWPLGRSHPFLPRATPW
ncbi:aldehyde dehydrogenase family protein [Streptomyces sp. NBC_00624]